MGYPLKTISIYTSTSPFSLEGEGWDEGDINGCFYSPHPNPLQQERELGCFVTLCICNKKKLCRYLCLRRDNRQGLTVRPELVEACHELVEWDGRLSRSWFDKAFSPERSRRVTTNGLTFKLSRLKWVAKK